jgi:hypothetical protein
MPAKRTSRPSAKRATPRKRRSVARDSTAVAEPFVMPQLRGRLVHEEEKRELILAHAAMRQQRDPVQMMSLWAGVAVASLVVVGGWAWAFAPTAFRASAAPAYSGFGGVVKDISNFGTNAKDVVQNGSAFTKTMNDATAKLDSLSSQVDTQQQVLDHMAASLGATSTVGTGGTRSDLFRPSSSSTQLSPPSSNTQH